MLSGRRLNILNPSPVDIEIQDLALGLSRLPRWNGQTVGEHAFSVAQHSLLVEALAIALKPTLNSRARLLALLHDAPEYVVGDLITPFKSALPPSYKTIENTILLAVLQRFHLPQPPDDDVNLIKRADRIAAWMEASTLALFPQDEADVVFGKPAKPPIIPKRLLTPLSPRDAQNAFLSRFLLLLPSS